MNKTSSAIVRTLLLGTSALCAVSLVPAKADPTGGVVVGGSATISSNGTSTIINQTTDKAVINWNTFSISAGGSVTFNQPGTGSFTLNRVTGSAPSTIYGSLTANGNVWLINGNGVMFGKGSKINVGGLIATTSDMDDQDFWNGNYTFKTGTGAAVVNQGTIKAGKRGSVVLSGSRVDNQGLIVADTGTVVLGGASAFTVDFTGDGLLRYQITQPAQTPDSGKPGVSNSGTIKAPGGQVIMTARAAQAVADAVVNNTGMISATSASVDQNGTVILDGGDGGVNVGGTIDASGTGSGQTGGNVSITGGNVTVADNATINVSGSAGGGTIKIGGGLHGDGSVAPADNVTIGKATLKADALKNGNGGTIVVWSDGRTDVGASFSARGGSDGGNGGLVETSGHTLNVRAGTTVDTRAPHGTTGDWLLDPNKIVVTDHPDGGLGDTDFLTPSAIIGALATTNVSLEATQEIDVNSALIFASSNSLSLLSGGSINIYASIENTQTSNGGDINIIAGWDGETSIENLLTTPGSFGSAGSEVYLHGLGEDGVSVGSASGNLLVAADFVTLYVGQGPSVQLGFHGGQGGNIAVVANTDVTLTGEDPTYGTNWAMIGNGAFDGSVTDAVTGDIDIKAGHALYMIGSGGHIGAAPPGGNPANEYVPTTAWIGNVGGSGTTSGNTMVVAGKIVSDTNGLLGEMIQGDLAIGNVTVGLTDSTFYTPGITVDSAHTLSLLSTGNMFVYDSIVNNGSGDINLVSGWDGITLDPAHFGDAGVFGNGQSFLGIGGEGAYGDVVVGSMHGNTNVLGSNVGAAALYGNVQIGFHGAGDGNIHVEGTHDIYLSANYGEGGTYTLQIGNGAMDGSAVGDVGGNVFVKAGGALHFNTYYNSGCPDCSANVPHGGGSQNESFYGQIAIGNVAGNGAISGATTIIAGSFSGNDQYAIQSSIYNDIAFGDVTVGTTGSSFYTPGLQFDSSHTLSLLSTGDMDVYYSIVNTGSGDINLVSGWDGKTLDPAHFGDAGVFGNGESSLFIGGSDGVLVVGSKHGNTNIFAGYAIIEAYNANTQIGYHGAGDGNITIKTTGDLYLGGQNSQSGTYWVHVGNGTFGGAADGDVGGNVLLDVGGTLRLDVYTGDAPPTENAGLLVGIGNAPGTGTTTGATTILAYGIEDNAYALSRNIVQDLAFGDVTVGTRNAEGTLQLDGAILTNTSHTLNLLSAYDVGILTTIQNSGTGAINVVAGWDGTTLDAGHFGDEGVFGNGGQVLIGGANAQGTSNLGSAGGDVHVYTGDLNVTGVNGVARLGFHGGGGGNIFVDAAGSITVTASGYDAIIGNGGLNVQSDVTGNISLKAGGQTAFFSNTGTSWLGNVAGAGFKETGDVTAITSLGFFRADFITADLGTTADTGGNVFIGFSNPEVGPVFIGGFDYNSAHDFTFAMAGTIQVTGLVQNAGAGAVTLVAGWDGETVGDAQAMSAAGVYGNNGGSLRIGGNYTYTIGETDFIGSQNADVAVGSASGTTTLLGQDVTIAPAAGFYAQVGYHGTGGGKIVINALGNLTLTGGETAEDFALIGNGGSDQSGAVTGDIDIHVGGTTEITAADETTNAWIGNLSSGSHTGNVSLITGMLNATNDFAGNVAADLAGGDFTLGITDSDSNTQIQGDAIYNSSHTLSILAAGNIEIDSSIQNAGTGAINIVAGWDGETVDPAHFGDAGVFGNNSGNLYIRGEGAQGSVAVGSQGATNIYASSVSLFGSSGSYAQIGYHGATGGDITILTTGAVTLYGGETSDEYAFIGNGTDYTVNTAGGAVTVRAGSIGASGVDGIAGGDVKLSANIGGIGDIENPIRIAATDLSIKTYNRDVYLVSPNLGVNLKYVSTVVYFNNTVEGATFSLDAGGAITQTGSIQSGVTNITTTSGNITLTDANNGFGAITVASPGDVSLTHFSLLTIASANVDGKLTLVAGTGINQGGSALVAGSLDATANDGAILLTNAGNTFASLTVHTVGSYDATITDSSAVSLGASSVGGIFTLHAGGAITQTGALISADLDVEAENSGNITLTDTGNSLGQIIVQTGGNASLTNSGDISVVYANVGNTLTLTAGGAITQFSSSSVANSFAPSSSTGIIAGSLVATANGGPITLTNVKNSFAALTVHTTGINAATVTDFSGVALGTSSVGGLFTLSAGGAITQTGALTSNGLDVSTSSGDITLTNAGNNFGTATVATPGNASLTASGVLTIAYADVGQKLTLSGTSVGQNAPSTSPNPPPSGIFAGALDVTATTGAINLTNALNSFGALNVHTTGSNAATITDSTGVALGASSVGGLFTLNAGGAITQTGALTSTGLVVSTTSGDITLTNAGNSFGAANVSTPGNASLTASGVLTIAYASVGQKLTLSGTSVGQNAQSTSPNPPPSGIIAAALDVTATTGTINLTNSLNSFGALNVHTTGSSAATITDATGVALGASSVGGLFTLSAGGAITQTGALSSGSLNAANTMGNITLDNANNVLGDVSLVTHGNATVSEAGAISIAGASADGSLTLHGGGAVTQSGAITANGLTVSTTSGAIQLTNTGNAVQGPVSFSTPGTASLYNTQNTVVGTTSVGGDYTLLSKGNVIFHSSVQDDGGAITVVAGWDGTTTDAASFGNSGVYGNNNGTIVVGGQYATGAVAVGAKTGATTFYAAYVAVGAINGAAQLGYHGTGGGDIIVRALHDMTLNAAGANAMLGNGSLGADVTGSVTGNIDIRIGGNAVFNNAVIPAGTTSAWLGNRSSGSETGNVLLIMNDTTGSEDHALSDFAAADLTGGDVTFGFTGTGDQGPNGAVAYNSSHTLTVLTVGNFVVAGSIQNAGTGAINIVAGWDGHTLDAAHFGDQGVYGNGSKGVIIGGADATGNASLGSAGGTTSIYGASLTLTALHGYAQLGFNGHGSGAINVTTTGSVTLTAGGSAGQFAQIGNGGLGTSGNNSGAIVIVAGGDVALNGGTGQEAYVQIGHGGAETNTGAQQGYSNVAPITITAANVLLNAGSGSAAYVQIGNGGYKSGYNIAGGTATNGGDITVTSGHTVSLNGNGTDAYAQIGNGGSLSNFGAAASAGGTDSGNIVVHAPNGAAGSVTVTAGAGSNAYAQIGNGGYSVNAGPTSTVANWTVTGDIHVTDLALTGGGQNGYGIIGNGDGSHNSFGNIFGDIYIDANGQITYTNGTGPHAPGTIGNFTGQGTVGGTIYGAQPPSEGGIGTNPSVIGVANTNTANNSSPTNQVTVIQTVPVNNDTDDNEKDDHSAVTVTTEPPGPLASLDETNTDGTPHDADSATVIIADSLNGAEKPGPTSLLGGLLKSIPASTNVHGVPSADQDFSSWGNEALWQ